MRRASGVRSRSPVPRRPGVTPAEVTSGHLAYHQAVIGTPSFSPLVRVTYGHQTYHQG